MEKDNIKEEEKCRCKEIMTNHNSGRIPTIWLHLSGCPETDWAKEYKLLPWHKKIFLQNPKVIYAIHKQQTGTY